MTDDRLPRLRARYRELTADIDYWKSRSGGFAARRLAEVINERAIVKAKLETCDHGMYRSLCPQCSDLA